MPNTVFEIEPDLTAIAIAFKNPEANYIAEKVFPYIDVESADFKYNEYPKEESFTVPNTRVGRTSEPVCVEFSAKDHTASVEDFALDVPVPGADVAKAKNSKYKPRDRATEGATNLVLLDRELRCAKIARNMVNYGQKETLSTGSYFDDDASNPIKTILDARSKMIVDPNCMVMSNEIWNVFRQHPKVVKATNKNSGDAGVAARQAVAELLEINEIIVGNTRYNRAKKGQSVILEPCWQGVCSLIYRDLTADTHQGITWGMTARFGDRFAGSYFDPKKGARGTEIVRAGECVKELVIAPDCGYAFENVLKGK